ncbi:TonB-dependent receptor [Lichenicoccus sp.]|uniref:TonB-dependent receptor n=1 Tax=Lichenicoccus sp. TaxID=2781899 RepID=UPI003D0FD5B9
MHPRLAIAALLASTTLSGLGPVAMAQTAGTGAESIVVEASKGHHTADGVTGLQPGGGLIKKEVAPKSRSSVTKDYIAKQAPAQSPFMLVQLLPGVVVSEVDPWGLSGGSLSMRGLDNTEMAFIWEGSPISDVGVYTTYPSEFADNENLEELTLQQGSSNIDTPTINGSGGLFTFHDSEPTDKFGGLADYGYGTYKYNREFIRLNSGEIGNTGIKAFISYSHQHDISWRGSGTDEKDHLDFKAVKDWGQGNHVSFVGAYQWSTQNSYTNPTLAQWGQLGTSYNYNGTYYPGDSNYWKLNRNPYRNVDLSAPAHFTLTDHWSADFTPYLWRGYGNAIIGTGLYETGNYQGAQLITSPVVLPYPITPTAANSYANAEGILAFEDSQYRGGFTAKTNYRLGINNFFAGWWFDYSNDHDTEPYSPVSYAGEPSNVYGEVENIKTLSGLRLLGQDIDTKTTVHALFLGDDISLLNDRLTFEAGFKEAIVNRDGTNMLPGSQYKSVLNDAQPLPAISARYQINTKNQVFASVTTNFRSPVNTTLYNTYSYLNGATTFLGGNNVHDEYSISEELGYRYAGDILVASATYFHYNFTNRQLQSVVPGTNGGVTTDINAGGQTSDGVDMEAGTRPIGHFRPYVSAQYLHATINNNIEAGGDYLPTTGKTAVRSPAWVFSAALDYDDGRFFGNYTVRYVGRQFATFMNDEVLPAYYEMGGTVGMRFHDIGPAKAPTIQLNLINLTNNRFLSGIDSLTSNAKTTTGVFGTTILGSAPLYNIGEGFAAIATVKSAF